MGTTTRALIAAAALVLAQPAASTATATPAELADRYIVTLADWANPQWVLNQLGVKATYIYGSALNGFAAPLTRTQIDLLKKLPVFKAIERDAQFTMKPMTRGRQSRAVGSWGLDRIDQRDLPLSNSYTAWHDGSSVTAYIIDSGIRYTHDEFGDRAKFAYDALDVVGHGNMGEDCFGHGTHVAGIVGGATYGVAKKITLASVRVIGCEGGWGWSPLIAGIDWVADHAVKPAVANLSISASDTDARSEAVDTAVNNLADKGVFVAVAAGNVNEDACYYTPSYAANAFTVAASTNQDGDWYEDWDHGNNYGECVDLYAPGAEITSADIDSDTDIRTESGTSMATPHVTGVAALYKQAYGDHSQSEIRNWLTSNASVDKIHDPAPFGDTPNRLLYKRNL